MKLCREGAIAEEFRVDSQFGPQIRGREGQVQVNGLSILALESLTRADYLFSIPHFGRRTSAYNGTGSSSETEHETHRDCYITSAGFRAVDSDFAPVDDILMRRPPVELSSSLAAFRADWPDPSRLAFVMMQFGSTKAHDKAMTAVRHALDTHQFVALRADDKQYHDDLWMNILTYMYGCRFGIGVFERIEDDAFNPNVSLEIGYMMGLGKPVCYLKERTLRTLHTDLVGRLYKEFDLHTCEETIPQAVWKWMSDKGLMSQQVETGGGQGTG